MTTQPACTVCQSPALPDHPLGLCAECWQVAEDIARQKIGFAIEAIRMLKEEHKDEGAQAA